MPLPASLCRHAFVFVAVALIACGSTNQTAQTGLDAFVKSRLGAHYTISYNSSRSYALCQQSGSADHINRIFKFLVVKTSNNALAKEGSFRNGYVKWVSDTAIEVSTSGLDEKTEKKIIDIEEQKS